jgi:hypothetical protein
MSAYELPGKVVAVFGPDYRVVEEHAGDRKFSLWGPDLAGRYCRMARYMGKGDALRSAERLSGCKGVAS